MLDVTIDGIAHRFEPGLTVLAAVRAAGADVPHVCHDDRLKPYGACRLCVVDIDGAPRPVAICGEALADGMVIRTSTPVLEALRRVNLGLMASTYPAEALASESDRPFHRLLARYGVAPGGGSEAGGGDSPILFSDDTHPYLGVAMDRCIHCYRCVRICEEVQGQDVWAVWGRGEETRIAPARGDSLLGGGCVACGACTDTCPTGALFDKRSLLTADRWTRTTCVYCGVGCQMDVGTRDGVVTQVKPAMAPVNRGHLCVKGRYAYDFATAGDRVTTPLVRRGGEWVAAGWDEALDHAAAALAGIRARHGADAIGVLGSARGTNEENYLAQKLARVALGTNNVDCCARVCHTPSAKALKTMLGTGAATNGFDDIEQAATFLVFGCNPTENHPIVGARIRQAVRRGARLVVVDPRRTELAAIADVHLAVRPGHNIELLNAMAAVIVEEGLVDAPFVADRVDGLNAFAAQIAAWTPERVAVSCGVAADDIRAAARLYAGTKPAMCFHGLGVTEHRQGTDGVMGLINLALLTGNIGRSGSGVNPLRGQNNVQGAAVMGCEPNALTGSQPIATAGARFEAVWGAPVPASHGLDLMRMVDAAAAGTFKALYAIGYDVYATLPNAHATAAALERLDGVIVQDLFLNETARAFGTVFLPAASFLERDGTFMNSDRRVQRIRAVAAPPGDARPDWWIIQELASRLGHRAGFDFDGPASIWDEVRRVWPAVAGLPYRRLEHESPPWPCGAEDHPGTPVLHQGDFAGGHRATLVYIPFEPTSEQCDADYPFRLSTGRTLYHFNAGTMTYRTPNALLRPQDVLEMAPADAERLGIVDGSRVRVASRYGEATLPVAVTDRVRTGELYTTFHRPELFVNRLTSGVRDNQVGTPEYKVTAVRVEGV